MLGTSNELAAAHAPANRDAARALLRSLIIGVTAFLTVVDLFATQAILPSLARAYDVSPAAMGFAVNASTMGMAVAGLAVAYFSRRIDRRVGILASLVLLSVPTALLAVAPDLATFTALRITQGVFMAMAFTLMLSYLGEACTALETAGAFAAYITGNVASNLFGRLLSAALADHLGLAGNFYVFAALNLAGAVLVYFYLEGTSAMPILGIAGLPLLVAPHLAAVLAGLALVGVGTFFAQAIATGFVGRAATTDRGAASGIYLACYFSGGLVGSAVLGQVFDRIGWGACVAGVGVALAVAAALARKLEVPAS